MATNIVRFIVLAFALLAGLKVWTQDRIYRSAVGDVVIQAYRERAEQACRKEFSKPASNLTGSWAALPGGEITVGNSAANVAFWDVDNPLWNVRFRHPQLVISSSKSAGMACTYDLIAGIATVTQR